MEKSYKGRSLLHVTGASVSPDLVPHALPLLAADPPEKPPPPPSLADRSSFPALASTPPASTIMPSAAPTVAPMENILTNLPPNNAHLSCASSPSSSEPVRLPGPWAPNFNPLEPASGSSRPPSSGQINAASSCHLVYEAGT